MKYILKTSHVIKDNFLYNLLLDRKIVESKEDYTEYQNPKKENFIKPLNLDYMDKGLKMLEKHLQLGNKILICVDCDCDGFSSAALLYNYLEDVLRAYYPDFIVEYNIPQGKEHGLSTLDFLFEDKKYDLIICPDSSSNDYKEHKILSEMGYDILVLDHHLAPHYSESAVVINNQLSPLYSNKELSGVGVVFKFLQYWDQVLGISEAENYLDLVAFGQISDMCSMNTPENRYICEQGLKNIKNEALKEIVNKQAYSLGNINDITQIGIAFYVTPLVNALIRVGTLQEKTRLFEAFIKGEELVPSTKRGEKGQFEKISTQNARNCTNARVHQNKDKEKAMALLDIQIQENCLENNKILILNADDLNVSTTLTGLTAMGVAAKYKKPVILGRTTPDGKYLKGSIRGQGQSELKDFRSFLLKSGLVEFVDGHANAAGCGLKISNINKLNTYANKELASINFNEGFYEADFIVNGNCSYLSSLIYDIHRGRHYWGQKNDEPVIIVENIIADTSSIKIMGANKDTLKICFNGIEYLAFKAKKLIESLNQFNGKVCLNIAGRASINSWGGKTTPQILLDEIEIEHFSDDDF